jgi:hypothetical protein
MRRITLPDDHWADLREPQTSSEPIDQLTVKGRRGVKIISGRLSQDARALIVAIQNMDPGPERDTASEALDGALSEDDVETLYRMQEATLAALLIDWSLDRPLPTVHTVGDLPDPLYQALVAEVATEAAAAVSLDLDMSVEAGPPDPKGRTGASKSSGSRSKAGKAPHQTRT